MNDTTKTIALSKAINLLKASGAKYKVIAADGTEYGELKIAVEPVKARRGAKYGWGKMTAYVRPHIENIQLGEVAIVPYSDVIDSKDVMHTAGKEMHRMFGNGASICAITKHGVEVLRVV